MSGISILLKSKPTAYQKLIQRAASYLQERDVVFVMTGAGMSVDCGLPDFRGDEGFYKNMAKINKNLKYYQIMSHNYFDDHPEKFWYLYGDRYLRYKQAKPHEGYNILKDLCINDKKNNYFLYTSNVDGLFLKFGFPEDKIFECHGNINFL